MKTYSWRKTPQGTYQIFKIPIFTMSKERNVTINNLLAALNKFQLDKRQSYYPRAFLGHHNSQTPNIERQGAGFLDNLYLDISGVMWADIVDIPEAAWVSIYNRNFVYVSVEWIPSEIIGLAFLSSSAPFFKFPPVLLEKEENMENPIIQFSRNMAQQDDKKDVKIDAAADSKESLPQTPVTPVESETPPESKSEDLGQTLREIKTGIQAILKHLIKHTEWEGQTTPTAGSVTSEAEKAPNPPEIKTASKTIYQADTTYQKLERDIAIMKFERDLEKRNLPKAMIDCAVSAAQKSKDLDSLNAAISFMAFSFESGHPAGQVIQKFSVSETLKKQVPEDQRKLAMQAEQAYNDTLSCGEKRTTEAFSKVFPTIDTFVSHILEQSKSDPQYLSKLTLKE